jgi:hypothetical protein
VIQSLTRRNRRDGQIQHDRGRLIDHGQFPRCTVLGSDDLG